MQNLLGSRLHHVRRDVDGEVLDVRVEGPTEMPWHGRPMFRQSEPVWYFLVVLDGTNTVEVWPDFDVQVAPWKGPIGPIKLPLPGPGQRGA